MNRLSKLKIAEISLVKRGAVPTARIALAKSAPETIAKGMEDYAVSHRRPDESVPQTISRLLRTDPQMQQGYELLTKAAGSTLGDHAHGSPLEDYARPRSRPGESISRTISRLLRTDSHMQRLYEDQR